MACTMTSFSHFAAGTGRSLNDLPVFPSARKVQNNDPWLYWLIPPMGAQGSTSGLRHSITPPSQLAGSAEEDVQSQYGHSTVTLRFVNGEIDDLEAPLSFMMKIADCKLALYTEHPVAVAPRWQCWTLGGDELQDTETVAECGLEDGAVVLVTFTPVKVPTVRWVVSAGPAHGMCLRDDGAVMTWGSNANGQLGQGKRKDEDDPVPHTVACTSDGAGGRMAAHNRCVQVSSGGRCAEWNHASHGTVHMAACITEAGGLYW